MSSLKFLGKKTKSPTVKEKPEYPAWKDFEEQAKVDIGDSIVGTFYSHKKDPAKHKVEFRLYTEEGYPTTRGTIFYSTAQIDNALEFLNYCKSNISS